MKGDVAGAKSTQTVIIEVTIFDKSIGSGPAILGEADFTGAFETSVPNGTVHFVDT